MFAKCAEGTLSHVTGSTFYLYIIAVCIISIFKISFLTLIFLKRFGYICNNGMKRQLNLITMKNYYFQFRTNSKSKKASMEVFFTANNFEKFESAKVCWKKSFPESQRLIRGRAKGLKLTYLFGKESFLRVFYPNSKGEIVTFTL